MKGPRLMVLALIGVSGCLGDRPADRQGSEQDGGIGGAGAASGGTGGGIGNADAHDTGSDTGLGAAGSGAGGQQTGSGGNIGAGGLGGGGTGVGGRTSTGGTTGQGGSGLGGAGSGGMTGAGGMVLGAAVLAGSTSKDFSTLALGTASTPFTWTISNATGAMSTGAPTLLNSDPTEVTTVNGCTAALSGGGSCTVTVTFRPGMVGARSATLTVLATPGGSAQLAITGTGTAQVTVTTVGTGTVTSVPAGISCPGTCTASFSTSPLTLKARTSNGSGAFFSGWNDPACPGPARDCAKSLTTATSAITATFSAMNANLIFGTLETFPTNLGGTAAYDGACNSVATSAGLNNSTGNGYVAMISDANSNAISRLANARGWIRLDGKPFADTTTGMFLNQQIFYPFLFEEDGTANLEPTRAFATATDVTGTALPDNCNNWTSSVSGAASPYGGSAIIGPLWEGLGRVACGSLAPLICLGKTKNVAVAPPAPPSTGKKIWFTGTVLTLGTETPDAHCQRSRPAGVNAAAALLSTTQKAASSVLVPTASYYRPDGAFVGTGADIAMMGAGSATLTSGIWQAEDGSYPVLGAAWTGSLAANLPGTIGTTCNNWTDSSQLGEVGFQFYATSFMWQQAPFSCTVQFSLYCVQTSP